MSQVVLYPCIVTYIAEGEPDSNKGILTRTYIGASAKTTAAYRTLLRIDLSLIGAATINDSGTKLEFYDTGIGDDVAGRDHWIYRVIDTNWTEEGVTWNKRDGVNNWAGSAGCSTSGTDYALTPTIYSDALGVAAPGWQVWEDASDPVFFADIVQDAVTSRGGMLDIIIRKSTGDEGEAAYSNYDSENTTAEDKHPKLTIDYTGGNVPNIANLGINHLQSGAQLYWTPVHWTCVKTIGGEPVADVKVLAGVSEH